MAKQTSLQNALEFFDGAKIHNDEVPDGFFTARQMATERGNTTANHVRPALDRMAAEGRAEVKQFRVNGQRVRHYRFL